MIQKIQVRSCIVSNTLSPFYSFGVFIVSRTTWLWISTVEILGCNSNRKTRQTRIYIMCMIRVYAHHISLTSTNLIQSCAVSHTISNRRKQKKKRQNVQCGAELNQKHSFARYYNSSGSAFVLYRPYNRHYLKAWLKGMSALWYPFLIHSSTFPIL